MPVSRRLTRDPLPDESLHGYLARRAEMDAYDNVEEMLRDFGSIRSRVFRAVTLDCDELAAVAAGLRVDPARLKRIQFAVPSDPRLRRLHHCLLPMCHLERANRRFAPASLRISPHIRARWHLKDLPFCPETGQILTDTCSACGHRQGWYHTVGIDRCDRCMADLSKSEAPFVAPGDREALDEVAAIFHPDQHVAEGALAVLPIDLSPAAVLELLIRTMRLIDPPLGERWTNGMERPSGSRCAAAMAEAWRLMRRWPEGPLELMGDRLARAEDSLQDGNDGASMRFLFVRKAYGLSSELRPVIEALNEHCRQIGDPKGAQREGLIAPKDAERALRVVGTGVAAARRKGALKTIFAIGPMHARPMHRADEIEEIRRQMDEGRFPESVSEELGVPKYAISQLVAAGIMENVPHPFVTAFLGEPQIWAFSFQRFKQRILDASQENVRGVSLTVAMRVFGGGPKPWAAIVSALLDGRIPFSLSTARPRLDGIEVCNCGFAEFHSRLRSMAVPLAELPDLLSKRDAGEILNLSPQKYGPLLTGLRLKNTVKRASVPTSAVLKMASAYISSVEIARRVGKSPRWVKFELLRLGLEQTSLAGYERAEVESLLNI